MEDGGISVDLQGAVAVVTLRSADGLNALDRAMLDRIGPAMQEADSLAGARVILVRSAGRHFCVGGDVRMFVEEGDRSGELLREVGPSVNLAARTLHESDKVTVCAVRGAVGGGALGFMSACDIVLAADDATFSFGYAMIGTSPDAGSSWFVTRDIGYRRALELYLTSERFGATRAHELGMVNRVVAVDELDGDALALAEQLARGPQAAMRRGKELFRAAATSPLAAHLDAEIEAFARNTEHPDFAEGVTAFVERRPPEFA